MTAWTLIGGTCGGCGCRVRAGDPLLALFREGSTWRLYRCPNCAGERPPADLVADPDAEPVKVVPFVSVRQLATTVRDGRMLATGERE